MTDRAKLPRSRGMPWTSHPYAPTTGATVRDMINRRVRPLEERIAELEKLLGASDE